VNTHPKFFIDLITPRQGIMHPLESSTPRGPARFTAAWAKLMLGLCLLAPLRIVLVIAFNIIGGILAEILILIPEQYSLPARRAVVETFGFGYLRILGLRRCSIIGKPDRRARLAASNHITWMDTALFAGLEYAQLAAKERLIWPLSRMSKLWHYINFDRSTPCARAAAAEAIAQRVKDTSKPPLLVYPEGTVTNGQSLLRFKLGVFAANAPVQPITISYSSPDCDVSWTFGCTNWLWRVLAQPYFDVRVEFLPIEHPEGRSAEAFAEAVRTKMARALKVQLSDVDARTAVLMGEAERLGLPLSAGKTFHSDPAIATKQHVGLLRAFAAVNTSKSGRITEHEIAAALTAKLQTETGLSPDDVVAAMGMIGTIGPPQFVEGVRRLLQRDSAHRRCGLMLLDPTGAVEAVYGGRQAITV
jgi:1-acyl-sn-glycerol-3-phosphate acyltransferase